MPRIFLTLVLTIILIGAGCSGSNGGINNIPSNDWKITFDTPSGGWRAYQMYGTQKFGNPALDSDERVWIQTSDKPILPLDFKANPELTYDDSDSWTMIDASYYPPNANPPKASVLQKMGDKDIWVVDRRKGSDLYYWKGEKGLYEMYFYSGSKSAISAEQVFSSIREVK